MEWSGCAGRGPEQAALPAGTVDPPTLARAVLCCCWGDHDTASRGNMEKKIFRAIFFIWKKKDSQRTKKSKAKEAN